MTAVANSGPPFPQLNERWIDKRARREVMVVAIGRARAGGDITVSYRYKQGVGGNPFWRRGNTPAQTVTISEWFRRFVPEQKETSKR